MTNFKEHIYSPLSIHISFHKIFEFYETLLQSDDAFLANRAKRILEIKQDFPFLNEGFSDISILETHKSNIQFLLQDAFSPILTHNEIKSASIPFQDVIFNSSERFKKIIKEAGSEFDLKMMEVPDDERYIMACAVILTFIYGYNLNFKRPFFYEIPDANGILHYYKLTYNADFADIIPTEKAPKITQQDFDELIDNFDNIELWKEKFPLNSYIFKGFVVSNMFDVTDDQSISNIKSKLISDINPLERHLTDDFHQIFQSLLKIKNLKVGFSIFNKEDQTFERIHGKGIESFLLHNAEIEECSNALCENTFHKLIVEKQFVSVSDVDKFCTLQEGNELNVLRNQGIKSAILAPIADGDELLGVLEIVSEQPKVLNSVNANKLSEVMPFIVASIKRAKREENNLIEAIIQQECTSIHPSVYWKFEKAARQFLKEKQESGNQVTFNKIVFEKVYPLFGQMDVKGSSEARNLATQKDLSLQLKLVSKITDSLIATYHLPIYEQLKFQVEDLLLELETDFRVDSEQKITAFLKNDIEKLFRFLAEKDANIKMDIDNYFSKIDDDLEVIYFHRKHYDDTIALINKNMAALLDDKQVEAQTMYPHYFERFKTDGVEHNMYIGESITKEESFNDIYLFNLRLWQLQVMCEMENSFYQHQNQYPIALDVASMILVFNQPLSIRFRMDEKQFDVDGTYNARYEVVKKRVDKAVIKGTEERVTQKGKITVIYSQKQDELEYLKYVKFLQSKKLLSETVEIVDVEDLQGVTGLKAIRVPILYHKSEDDKAFYTYEDLLETLKS
jgi:rubrerythrin